ncbi:MAG: STAS domain-containing protein [Pirellulales bacterium]|nr:STAS domain-containing protein [Pirellulales bacterium]
MNLPTETFDHVVVVHTPEELGRDQADDFTAFMSTLDRRSIVLDMDQTETVDSGGLTALLDVYDAAHDHGGDLKIATRNPTTRKIFELTRLDQQLEIFETVIDAVKSFR